MGRGGGGAEWVCDVARRVLHVTDVTFRLSLPLLRWMQAMCLPVLQGQVKGGEGGKRRARYRYVMVRRVTRECEK